MEVAEKKKKKNKKWAKVKNCWSILKPWLPYVTVPNPIGVMIVRNRRITFEKDPPCNGDWCWAAKRTQWWGWKQRKTSQNHIGKLLDESSWLGDPFSWNQLNTVSIHETLLTVSFGLFWPGWTSNYPSFQAPDAKGASIEELKEKATGFHTQPSLLWSQNMPGLIEYVQVCPFNEIRITDRAMSLLRGRRCWGKFPTNVLEPICVICICSQCLWAANSPRQADNSRKAISERSQVILHPGFVASYENVCCRYL